MPDASLIITNSGVPGFVPEPGFLDFGELSLNWSDGALYFKDSDGVVQTIAVSGALPLALDHIPTNEGPWMAYSFIGNPANSAYVAVQKVIGTLPRIKIGSIPDGPNAIEVDGTDITISIVAGTTTNQIKGLITSNADANELIYFYNVPGSDGTGIAIAIAIESAVFENVNAISGDRGEYLGQRAITAHSDSTFSEWSAVALTPTQWSPLTPGVIFNNDTTRWEKMYAQDGTFQSDLLPDQAPI